MMRSDQELYRARAQEEFVRAQLATNVCARRAHLELARLYTDRLRDDVFVASRRGEQPDVVRPGHKIIER